MASGSISLVPRYHDGLDGVRSVVDSILKLFVAQYLLHFCVAPTWDPLKFYQLLTNNTNRTRMLQ